jgi:hypothetical protein
MKQHYIRITKEMAKELKLNPTEILILGDLINHWNTHTKKDSHHFWYQESLLAEKWNVSVRTVERAIKNIHKKVKFFSITRNKSGAKNGYQILRDSAPEWAKRIITDKNSPKTEAKTEKYRQNDGNIPVKMTGLNKNIYKKSLNNNLNCFSNSRLATMERREEGIFLDSLKDKNNIPEQPKPNPKPVRPLVKRSLNNILLADRIVGYTKNGLNPPSPDEYRIIDFWERQQNGNRHLNHPQEEGACIKMLIAVRLLLKGYSVEQLKQGIEVWAKDVFSPDSRYFHLREHPWNCPLYEIAIPYEGKRDKDMPFIQIMEYVKKPKPFFKDVSANA